MTAGRTLLAERVLTLGEDKGRLLAANADLAERVFVLRGTLYNLLHLRAMVDAGQAYPDQREREARAWELAAEVYGADGPGG